MKLGTFIAIHILLYTGILGFSGCMVVIAEYGDHEKGWAFYLSLVASSYVILQVPYSDQIK